MYQNFTCNYILPGLGRRYPKRHSTYGRVKVKTIQLFLGKYSVNLFSKTIVNHIRKKSKNCQPKSGKDNATLHVTTLHLVISDCREGGTWWWLEWTGYLYYILLYIIIYNIKRNLLSVCSKVKNANVTHVTCNVPWHFFTKSSYDKARLASPGETESFKGGKSQF